MVWKHIGHRRSVAAGAQSADLGLGVGSFSGIQHLLDHICHGPRPAWPPHHAGIFYMHVADRMLEMAVGACSTDQAALINGLTRIDRTVCP